MTRKEAARLSAEWWAEQLNIPQELSGVSANRLWALKHLAPLDTGDIQKFREALEVEIEKFLEPKLWRQKKPKYGSAQRCIAFIEGPSATLTNASLRSGVRIGLRMPFNTKMWISPDGVLIKSGQRVINLS